MGLGHSLRAVVGQFGAAHQEYDEYTDDADSAPLWQHKVGASADHDDIYGDESRPHVWQARAHEQRPLALVPLPRVEFTVIAPQDFADVQQIADRLRADAPVIIDLERCGAELSKRLIDFCSGLTYALEAELQFIGEHVVLLTPRDLELSSEAFAGLCERRFFNQI